MAQKPKKQPDFYEQLIAQAGRTLPEIGRFDWDKFLRQARELLTEAGNFMEATFEDVGFAAYNGVKKLSALTKKPAGKVVLLAAIIGTIGLSAEVAYIASQTYSAFASDITNPRALMSRNNQGTTITDRKGLVLYRTNGADNSIPVKFTAVPKSFVEATLAAEDPDFYHHGGVSLKSTGRALFADLTNRGNVQGGSTLTQQFVKTALLSPEKSYTRKLREIVLAEMLERHYTKDQILELYFNEVYYGQGSRGAERAAETYFHKPLNRLSLSQEAMLAGLPLGPNRFDPNFDPSTAKARRDYILSRMAELNYITPQQEVAAKKDKLISYPQQVEIKAPHFVLYVLDQLRQKYGEDLLVRGGITVRTTLDYSKQKIAEQEVKNQISQLAYQHVTNAGLVALDPRTGEVLAMVGSVDFNNRQFGKVNTTLSQFQPGSSFKPFVYATAFKKGYNGATMVVDSPISINDGSGTPYRPVNYDGKFRGPVLLRRALGNSLNVPTVKVEMFAGVSDTIKTATDMGITTLGPASQYGLSLALGSADIRPIDLAAAYATFAEMGSKVTPRTVISVTNRSGKNITINDDVAPKQALDPRIAYMIINILGDNNARTEEFGPNSPLLLDRPSFAKTGTTNDFRDNFTAGSTPQLTTVVWVGNNDHSPMIGVNGITGAAPIWHNFMERSLAGSSVLKFTEPSGLVTKMICSSDGGLVNPWNKGIPELFLKGNLPTKYCSSAPKSKAKAKNGKSSHGHGDQATEPPKQQPLFSP